MTQFAYLFDAHPFSDTSVTVGLTTGTEETWTVPGLTSQKYRAQFSFNDNDDIYVALNVTAVVSTANTVSSTPNQELRPTPKFVSGGDVLHFITSAATAQIGVTLLSLPSPV